VSYADIAALAKDEAFQERVKVSATIDCQTHLDDPNRADWSNLAYDTLRGADHVMDTFIRFVAQTTGIADGYLPTIDQTTITDEAISTAVDAAYPIIASLWYNPDGTPWGGAMHPPVGEEVPPIEEVPPAITSFDPISGGADTLVTIIGVGLTNTARVNIGADCGNLTVVDDTQVTCTIANPRPSKGFYDVIVEINAINYTAATQFQIT
jgi:hypothetical protein